MTFNGSGQDEIFDVSANGQRVRFFRNLGNIVMDLRRRRPQIDPRQPPGGIDSLTVTPAGPTSRAHLPRGRSGRATADGHRHGNGTDGNDAVVVDLRQTARDCAASRHRSDVTVADDLAGGGTPCERRTVDAAASTPPRPRHGDVGLADDELPRPRDGCGHGSTSAMGVPTAPRSVTTASTCQSNQAKEVSRGSLRTATEWRYGSAKTRASTCRRTGSGFRSSRTSATSSWTSTTFERIEQLAGIAVEDGVHACGPDH